MDPPDKDAGIRDIFLDILSDSSEDDVENQDESDQPDADSFETPPPRLSIGAVMDQFPRIKTGIKLSIFSMVFVVKLNLH